MARKVFGFLVLILATCSLAEARESFSAYCQRGGQNVVTQGLKSSGLFQRTFQSCTIHVYLAGTTTLASPLFSDNLTPASTPLANPFTAASDGYFQFYAGAGRYDVQETYIDTTVTPPVTIQVTWGDIELCDSVGPNQDSICSGIGPTLPHNLLSVTHSDTVPFTPPLVGDLIRGSTGNLWERFPVGTLNQVLTVQNSGPSLLPTWTNPATVNGCVTVQNNGTEFPCEPEINFIPGSNITLGIVNNPGNSSNDVTITASGGGASPSCDPTKVVNLYVDPAGSDLTGTGTLANPWATIQHAWNVGVPGFVDGRYIINLKSQGTYAASSSLGTILDGKIFADSFDYTNCATPLTPCSGVTIEGNSTSSEKYILSVPSSNGKVVTVEGANVRFHGLQIGRSDGAAGSQAGFGLYVTSGSHVVLGAVSFYNESVGLFVGQDAQVFYENCGFSCNDGTSYVDDCSDAHISCDTVRFDNTVVGGVPFAAQWAMQILGGTVTDICDANKEGNNASISIYQGGGQYTRGIWIPAGSLISSNAPGVSILGAKTGVLTEGNAQAAINFMTIDGGTNSATARGIGIDGGSVVCSMWECPLGQWALQNLLLGVNVADFGGRVSVPAFTSVTTKYQGGSSSSFPVTVEGHASKIDEAGVFFVAGYAGGSNAVHFDLTQGNYFKLTLTKNTTADITSASDGTHVTIIFKQDGAGGHTVTLANSIGFDTVDATINLCSMQSFVFDAATTQWFAQGPMLKGITCASF